MKNLGYYNGVFGEAEEMTIPFNDRVSFFGDGVYDATYSRGYKIFCVEEHIDRLFNSARLLDIKIRETKEELKSVLEEMVKKMETGDNFVYFQVTRGTGKRNHVYDEDMVGNLWINIYPKNIVDLSKSVSAITMEDTRFFHCNIKTLNLIPAVMANQAAKAKGCFEAIFHRNGRVTECAHSNVHIIKNGVFKTAPLDNLILPGTTRRHLIEQCGKLGIPVEEKEFYLDELFDADEIIVSSAGALCVRVRELDGKAVGGKAEELITKLQKVMLEHFYETTK